MRYPVNRMYNASEAILGHRRVGLNQHEEAYKSTKGNVSSSSVLSRYLEKLNTHLTAHYDHFNNIAKALYDGAANQQAMDDANAGNL